MDFVAPIRTAAASCIKQHASCTYSLVNQRKVTLHNDIKFPTVYHMIYCRKFMTLSNQMSHCICKCIRISLTEMSMEDNDVNKLGSHKDISIATGFQQKFKNTIPRFFHDFP